jgi:hypothetical protein
VDPLGAIEALDGGEGVAGDDEGLLGGSLGVSVGDSSGTGELGLGLGVGVGEGSVGFVGTGAGFVVFAGVAGRCCGAITRTGKDTNLFSVRPSQVAVVTANRTRYCPGRV